MTVPIARLRALEGMTLPGGTFVVESHEAFIADEALRSATTGDDGVHPIWFVFASLRCMGITVDELCALAHKDAADVLLFGNCSVLQHQALIVGRDYISTAAIGNVGSRTTRDGSRLDSIDVAVRLSERGAGHEVGEVVSTYMFKRGNADG